MEKQNFLKELWQLLGLFLRMTRHEPLINDAVGRLENKDLLLRAFHILSILYGSFEDPPHKLPILREFIDMLDKDLDEIEIDTCVYAKTKTSGFFPELIVLSQNIRTVYGTKEFATELLPPTIYQAYTLLTLNRPQDILNKTSHAKLFGEIHFLYCFMRNGLDALYSPLGVHAPTKR